VTSSGARSTVLTITSTDEQPRKPS